MAQQPLPEGEKFVFSHPTQQEVKGIFRRLGQPVKVTLVWNRPGKPETHVYDLSTEFVRRHKRGLSLWMKKADKVIVEQPESPTSQ